jgi:hypothetical protein
MTRYLFTDSRPTAMERLADYALAIVLGIVFAVLAMVYFS